MHKPSEISFTYTHYQCFDWNCIFRGYEASRYLLICIIEYWNGQIIAKLLNLAYSGGWVPLIFVSRCWPLDLNWRWSLQWRDNERDAVSNHQLLDYLPNRLFRRWSKKTPKLRVTVHCEGNPWWRGHSPHTQSASNVENVSIWWRHQES